MSSCKLLNCFYHSLFFFAMIQPETILKVADNSGVKELKCINVLGHSRTRGGIGDLIVGSVRKRIPTSEVEKGDLVKAVIIRTKEGLQRPDGSYIRFDDNAAILVNNYLEPIGTRIFGPVTRELRAKNMLRVISLAPEVL